MITIYGKANCGFCTKAKSLVESKLLKYEYKDVGISQSTLDELMERAPVPVKSVPQIFINDKYIGGYTEMIRYIEETSYNGTGWTL
jgi:glutaredoxin|tara:strand:- start:11374 stop:11631 length:258 start_codon:yes stop_codon:yes gene_type:complete